MAYIYKITNLVNGKMYVGQTAFNLQYRLKQHFHDAKRGKQRPLCRAIRKYGEENFSIELIEETKFLAEREIYWIQELNTYKKGYNATKGGEGRLLIEKEEILQLWEELGKCPIKELAALVEHDYSYLCKLFIEWQIERPLQRKKQQKRVAQLDPITLEVISEFNSLADAARSLGVRPQHSHISKVCDGKRSNAYGYKWRWL